MMTLTTMISSYSVIDPVVRDIIKAAKEGDAELLQSLFRENLPAKLLINALCYAAGNRHLQCCTLLLDNGTDVNGVGLYGSTPLSTAVAVLDRAIVTMLLQCGADVNIGDELGRSPLMAAILKLAEIGLLRLLLDAGADANIVDSRGLSPLWATLLDNGNPEIMGLLLEYGADASIPYFGKTLLEVVRKNGLMAFERVFVEFQK